MAVFAYVFEILQNSLQCPPLADVRPPKMVFGNALSPMERGTPSSDNQESFFACLIVVKNDSVFHSRNLYNVEFERVSS